MSPNGVNDLDQSLISSQREINNSILGSKETKWFKSLNKHTPVKHTVEELEGSVGEYIAQKHSNNFRPWIAVCILNKRMSCNTS